MRKVSYAVIFTAIFTLLFFGCDFFNPPLKDYIRNATGRANGLDYEILTDHYMMDDGTAAIPPADVSRQTMVNVFLSNKENYDLQITLEGPGSEYADFTLSNDKQTALVTLLNQPRAVDSVYVFDLVLNITANDRPMPSIKLPRMECRYLDDNLAGLSVSSPSGAALSPPFGSDTAAYTVSLPRGTSAITLSGILPHFGACLIQGVRKNWTSGSPEFTHIIPVEYGVSYTVPITVTADSGKTNKYFLEITWPEYPVNIYITAPMTGEVPDTAAAGEGNFNIGPVSWIPNHATFRSSTVYTATVTLTALSGGSFNGNIIITINGMAAVIVENSGSSVTLSHIFAATDSRTLDGIFIKDQPAKMVYTHGDELDLSGLAVTLTYDDASTINAAFADFEEHNLFTVPLHGAVLYHLSHNGQSVEVRAGSKTAYTDPLTVNKADGAYFLTLSVESIIDAAAGEKFPSITIARSGAGQFYKVEVTGTYDSITWEIDGVGAYAGQTITDDGKEFRLDGSEVRYNTLGGHVLKLIVEKGGRKYQVNIPFTVVARIFTSVDEFGTWLAAQPDNIPATAYAVKLNVSDLGGTYETIGSVRYVLETSTKYVSLDLSGSTITSIGVGVFQFCENLTSVIIPDSVTEIGPVAFENCHSLTSIIIPNSVTSIGQSAFSSCTSLTSVTIPDSITTIGYFAFGSCRSLTTINVDPANTAYSSENGVLYNKDKKTLILYPSRKTGAFTIPNSVTSIEDNAFTACTSLTSITIPDSVTTIGYFAFWGTSLTSVIIPNGVTSIGKGTFSSCTSLTSVIIPDSVTSIGIDAFAYCSSLTSVTIPNSVTNIGYFAFWDTSLTSVTFQGTIAAGNFDTYNTFPGDLRAKYLANGKGRYTRASGGTEWTKVD